MIQSEKTDRTHQELLKAAQTLFLERGFDRTSIADIASLSGYSTGAFYRHYKTKSDILIELWADFLDDFISGSIEHTMNTGSLEEAVDVLVKRSIEYFSHPMFICYHQASIVRGLKSSPSYTPDAAKDFTSMLYRLLQREYPNGDENRLHTYACTLHATINAYSSSETLNQDYYFDETIIREIILLLVKEAGAK